MNYTTYVLCFGYYELLLMACVFIGCLFLRRSFPLEYKLMVILSGLTLLVESMVVYFFFSHAHKPWIYNFFGPVECAFIVYIFYRASTHQAVRRLHVFLLFLLPVGIGISYWMYSDLFRINDKVILYCIFTNLIAACSYLADILLNKTDVPMVRYPFFWMAAGMLLFCCSYVMVPALLNYLRIIPVGYSMLYSLLANTFMYSGFIACFVCFRRLTRPLELAGQPDGGR